MLYEKCVWRLHECGKRCKWEPVSYTHLNCNEVKWRNGFPVSNKGKNGGIGLLNVQSSIKKYDGDLTLLQSKIATEEVTCDFTDATNDGASAYACLLYTSQCQDRADKGCIDKYYRT